jgi:hypothetical protein
MDHDLSPDDPRDTLGGGLWSAGPTTEALTAPYFFVDAVDQRFLASEPRQAQDPANVLLPNMPQARQSPMPSSQSGTSSPASSGFFSLENSVTSRPAFDSMPFVSFASEVPSIPYSAPHVQHHGDHHHPRIPRPSLPFSERSTTASASGIPSQRSTVLELPLRSIHAADVNHADSGASHLALTDDGHFGGFAQQDFPQGFPQDYPPDQGLVSVTRGVPFFTSDPQQRIGRHQRRQWQPSYPLQQQHRGQQHPSGDVRPNRKSPSLAASGVVGTEQSSRSRRPPRRMTSQEDAVYQCEVKGCGKLFSRSYNFKAHLETHDEKRDYPFPCPIDACDKKFVRKTDLQRHHQSVHMKQRNHKCDFCGRLFARKDTLRRYVCSAIVDITQADRDSEAQLTECALADLMPGIPRMAAQRGSISTCSTSHQTISTPVRLATPSQHQLYQFRLPFCCQVPSHRYHALRADPCGCYHQCHRLVLWTTATYQLGKTLSLIVTTAGTRMCPAGHIAESVYC